MMKMLLAVSAFGRHWRQIVDFSQVIASSPIAAVAAAAAAAATGVAASAMAIAAAATVVLVVR
jgi:hypothetical protein